MKKWSGVKKLSQLSMPTSMSFPASDRLERISIPSSNYSVSAVVVGRSTNLSEA